MARHVGLIGKHSWRIGRNGKTNLSIVKFDETSREGVELVFEALDNWDVAILSYTRVLEFFVNASPKIESGDFGYILGYDLDGILKMSLRVISVRAQSLGFEANQDSYIAAHVDSRYSGGPMCDQKGHVKGMTLGCKGQQVVSTWIMNVQILVGVVQLFWMARPTTMAM